MATIYYKNGMMGGTSKDREEFYNLLKGVQENSCRSISQWDGDYLKTTYTSYDGNKAIYLENMEYGIPHSLEIEED